MPWKFSRTHESSTYVFVTSPEAQGAIWREFVFYQNTIKICCLKEIANLIGAKAAEVNLELVIEDVDGAINIAPSTIGNKIAFARIVLNVAAEVVVRGVNYELSDNICSELTTAAFDIKDLSKIAMIQQQLDAFAARLADLESGKPVVTVAAPPPVTFRFRIAEMLADPLPPAKVVVGTGINDYDEEGYTPLMNLICGLTTNISFQENISDEFVATAQQLIRQGSDLRLTVKFGSDQGNTAFSRYCGWLLLALYNENVIPDRGLVQALGLVEEFCIHEADVVIKEELDLTFSWGRILYSARAPDANLHRLCQLVAILLHYGANNRPLLRHEGEDTLRLREGILYVYNTILVNTFGTNAAASSNPLAASAVQNPNVLDRVRTMAPVASIEEIGAANRERLEVARNQARMDAARAQAAEREAADAARIEAELAERARQIAVEQAAIDAEQRAFQAAEAAQVAERIALLANAPDPFGPPHREGIRDFRDPHPAPMPRCTPLRCHIQ
jgi:hypothetical protein